MSVRHGTKAKKPTGVPPFVTTKSPSAVCQNVCQVFGSFGGDSANKRLSRQCNAKEVDNLRR